LAEFNTPLATICGCAAAPAARNIGRILNNTSFIRGHSLDDNQLRFNCNVFIPRLMHRTRNVVAARKGHWERGKREKGSDRMSGLASHPICPDFLNLCTPAIHTTDALRNCPLPGSPSNPVEPGAAGLIDAPRRSEMDWTRQRFGRPLTS